MKGANQPGQRKQILSLRWSGVELRLATVGGFCLTKAKPLLREQIFMEYFLAEGWLVQDVRVIVEL